MTYIKEGINMTIKCYVNGHLFLILSFLLLIGITFISSDLFIYPHRTIRLIIFSLCASFLSINTLLNNRLFEISFIKLGLAIILFLIFLDNIQNDTIFKISITFSGILLMMSLCTINYKPGIYKIIALLGLIQALLCWLQYYNIYPSLNIYFNTTGSYENPTGSAIVLLMASPYIYHLIKYYSRTKYQKLGYIMIMMTVISSIFLLESRAAMLAIFIYTLYLAVKFSNYKTKSILICVFCMVILSISLFLVKTNSAIGRFYIWEISLNMVAEKPLWGWGDHGFKANYMLFQADYFIRNPNSLYGQLANNISHPFNEFLLLIIRYGLIRFFFIIFMFVCFIKKIKNIADAPIISIFLFAIFSLFSYPFQYLTPVILLIISVFLSDIETNSVVIRGKRLKSIIYFFSITSVILCLNYVNKEREWKTLLSKEVEASISEYEIMYPKVKTIPEFLYQNAIFLHSKKMYQSSSNILEVHNAYNNSYDSQLLYAENHLALMQYAKAEKSFILSANMIPNRFYPKYELLKIYKDHLKNKGKAIEIANEIIELPIKIKSPYCYSVKEKAKNYLITNLP